MQRTGQTAESVRPGERREGKTGWRKAARADINQESHVLTDYRVYRFGTGEALLTLLEGAAALLAISWLFYDTWIAAAVLSPLLIFWMKQVRLYRCEKRKEKLNLEFREALNSLSSAARPRREFLYGPRVQLYGQSDQSSCAGREALSRLREKVRRGGHREFRGGLFDGEALRRKYDESYCQYGGID